MTVETTEQKIMDVVEAVAEAAVEVVLPVAAVEALFDLYRHDVTGKAHDLWGDLHALVAKAKADLKEVVANV